VVAGAGPAGSVAAAALARLGLDVVLIDGSVPGEVPIGETLTPDAGPVLTRLGLEDAVTWPNAIPSYGTASSWGGPELERSSFVFHPLGSGWDLDRRRFDAGLRTAAGRAGARIVSGARVTSAARRPNDRWRLELDAGGAIELCASGVIDATGRRAWLSRGVGARRHVHDHLVGVAVRYSGRGADGGHTLVETERDGWWYSARLPGGDVIVVEMTDADLSRSGGLTDIREFAARVARVPATARRVEGRAPRCAPRVTSAVTHRLRSVPDLRMWLAAGDAAIGVDPLSSSGLLHALSSGEAAARAMANLLLGRPRAAADYEHALDSTFAAYRLARSVVYSWERRWPDAPFWLRRAPAEGSARFAVT
jgi:flavin-dependent dehydrogenase